MSTFYTKPTLAQYDVTVTLTGTDPTRAYSHDTLTFRVPAASPELAGKIGRAIGEAIIEGTDQAACWPLLREPVNAQPVNPEIDPDTDEEVGPREAYLRMEAKRQGFPLSAKDIEHERHVDNCAKCQEEEADRRGWYSHEQRLENSRHALLSFMYQVQDTLKALGNWKAADKPLPPTQEFADKLTVAARKASAAYQRAMKS